MVVRTDSHIVYHASQRTLSLSSIDIRSLLSDFITGDALFPCSNIGPQGTIYR